MSDEAKFWCMKGSPYWLMVFFLLASSSLQAQRDFGQRVMDTLCSPEYHGRGYVKDGHKKAADHIASKFEDWGLESFGGDHFQRFNVDVNTFPGAMEVVLDGDTLDPGTDYIVDPASGTARGTYELFRVDRKNFAEKLQSAYATQNFFEGKAALFDPRGFESKDTLKEFLKLRHLVARRCPVVLLEYGALNWGGSREELPHPVVRVKADSGHRPFDELRLNIENKFREGLQTQNVIGYVEGNTYPDSFLVVGAHYDHLGRMGADTYIPGANDNASGTAMMLYLARHYAKNPPELSIAFVGFGAEEIGLAGSKHFVENTPIPLDRTAFLLNLDILGSGEEGITVVNGKHHPRITDRLDSINESRDSLFPRIKRRGKAMNSDHHWFTEEGVPAFFIYTLGDVKAYHDVRDKPENVPITAFNELAVLFREFLSTFVER